MWWCSRLNSFFSFLSPLSLSAIRISSAIPVTVGWGIKKYDCVRQALFVIHRRPRSRCSRSSKTPTSHIPASHSSFMEPQSDKISIETVLIISKIYYRIKILQKHQCSAPFPLPLLSPFFCGGRIAIIFIPAVHILKTAMYQVCWRKHLSAPLPLNSREIIWIAPPWKIALTYASYLENLIQ